MGDFFYLCSISRDLFFPETGKEKDIGNLHCNESISRSSEWFLYYSFWASQEISVLFKIRIFFHEYYFICECNGNTENWKLPYLSQALQLKYEEKDDVTLIASVVRKIVLVRCENNALLSFTLYIEVDLYLLYTLEVDFVV